MEELPKATATMKGGEDISNGSSSCSICFFGTYNGKASMITCGHTNAVGTNIYYGGTKVGTVTKQNLKTFDDTGDIKASYGDFSIVDISGGCVVYKVSENVNRVAGCITGVKEGVYSYVTPASYIEASGFSFN